MAYRVPNPLPLAMRLRAIAREEGPRAAFDRVATYGRLRLAKSRIGKAVGLAAAPRSTHVMGTVWADLAASGVFFGTPAPSTPNHIAVIAETALPQCTRYRVHQLEALGQALGVGVTVADHRNEAEALTALQMASHVVFYRLEPSQRAWMYLYEARRLGVKVLYDLDDPLFSVPAVTGSRAELPPALVRHFADAAPGFLGIMSACDAISVSTPALAEVVRRFLPRPVFVRRNFADAEMLGAQPRGLAAVPGGPGVTLACASGSEGRQGDLAPILAELAAFLAADKSRRLILIGSGFEVGAGLPLAVEGQVAKVPFLDYPSYLAQLAEADAVLVPLSDDPYNACKSAVRAMDAAAAGRAVIASPRGDMATAVVDGVTGWLAETPADWAQAFAAVARTPDRCRTMGDHALAHLRATLSDPTAPEVTEHGLQEWFTR